MRYAHVTNGTVDRYGQVEDFGHVVNLIDGDDITGHPSLDDVTALGWLPVVEEVAPLGPDQHHGEEVVTVRTDDVLLAIPAEDDSAETIATRTKSANVDAAVTPLRQWSLDADALSKKPTAISAAEHKEIVRRLGIFFDRFADLIETRL